MAAYLLSALRSPPEVLLSPVSIWQLALFHFYPDVVSVQAKEILEENGKAEQQPLNQSEQNPEKKTSLLRKLDEKKKECAERDAKQQAVKKKRNYDMSL